MRKALELVRRADPAATLTAAIRVGTEDHSPRQRVKAVGNAYTYGTLAFEEAAGHPDCRPARADRCRNPVRRHCHGYSLPSFFLVLIDLLLQTEGDGADLALDALELADVDGIGRKDARCHIGDDPLVARRAH